MARQYLDRALIRIEEKARLRAKDIAEFIARGANELAPVDEDRHRSHQGSPRLKGSYKAKPSGRGWAVATDCTFWRYVEFGTHRQAPEPHVRPAIEAARQVYRR